MLYLRPLDSIVTRPLPGTQDASQPFWSPDSKSIAFASEGKLKRIEVAGGAIMSLADARTNAPGGSWSSDGVILFGNEAVDGIDRIAASGGMASAVTRIDRQAGYVRHMHPRFLPGGKEFLYLVAHNDEAKTGIAVGSMLAKPEAPPAIFLQTSAAAYYHPASKLLFYIQGASTLTARRLELNPPRLEGDPIVVAEGVQSFLFTRAGDFSISDSGTLSYVRGGVGGKARFAWRDRTGKVLERFGDPIQAIGSFDVSPDGTRVAYYAGPSVLLADVWVMDLTRAVSTRLTFNHGAAPRWSPDGKFIYYTNGTGIHRKAADGSGEEVLLHNARSTDYINSISPDGSALLFGRSDIMRLPLNGKPQPEPFLKTEHVEWRAAFSPDGRWVAYHSNESGRFEVYVQGYPDKRGKWLISSGGGTAPVWRRDGKEIFWATGDGTVFAAPIELTANSVRPGPPQALFHLPNVGAVLAFQVSRDGQKFLVYDPESSEQERQTIVVIQNWTARAGN